MSVLKTVTRAVVGAFTHDIVNIPLSTHFLGLDWVPSGLYKWGCAGLEWVKGQYDMVRT